MKNNIIIFLLLIGFGIISRFLPHPPNFTAIMAIGLFAGYQFRGKFWSVLIPLAAMLLSDWVLGFHETIWAVYIAVAAIAAWGAFGLKNVKPLAIAGSSIAGSLFFFFITNAAHWWFVPMYSHDSSGLMQAYIAGLPFLRNAMLGDLFFNALFFGAFYGISSALKPKIA